MGFLITILPYNFTKNDSRHPPRLCAEPPSNNPRTIPMVQNHRHLKDQFYNLLPSIYNFIEVLTEQQAEI